jgi:hypothetical protein
MQLAADSADVATAIAACCADWRAATCSLPDCPSWLVIRSVSPSPM